MFSKILNFGKSKKSENVKSKETQKTSISFASISKPCWDNSHNLNVKFKQAFRSSYLAITDKTPSNQVVLSKERRATFCYVCMFPVLDQDEVIMGKRRYAPDDDICPNLRQSTVEINGIAFNQYAWMNMNIDDGVVDGGNPKPKIDDGKGNVNEQYSQYTGFPCTTERSQLALCSYSFSKTETEINVNGYLEDQPTVEDNLDARALDGDFYALNQRYESHGMRYIFTYSLYCACCIFL